MRELLDPAVEQLVACHGDASEARLEAELLLAHGLGLTRAQLVRVLLTGAPAGEPAWAPATDLAVIRAEFQALLRQRLEQRRPLAYLLGWRDFWDLRLVVDEGVLVPRPDTECLVEALLDADTAGELPDGVVYDVGTGSGAVALALSERRSVLAGELSPAALDVARRNLARLARGEALAEPGEPPDEARRARGGERAARVLLLAADGLGAVGDERLAAVVANPPYVEPGDHARLQPEVRHEPRVALVPADGDVRAVYAGLAREARRVLRPGGLLLVEVGAGQAGWVARACGEAGLEHVGTRPDLAGIPRVVVARRPTRADDPA